MAFSNARGPESRAKEILIVRYVAVAPYSIHVINETVSSGQYHLHDLNSDEQES
jgi:hypothetical protein